MRQKPINQSDIVNYRTQIESQVNLTSESMDSVQFIKDSVSSSYWDFFKYNYYDNTGSFPYTAPVQEGFLGYNSHYFKQFKDKYNVSASYIGISSADIGEGIIPQTFVLKDNSKSSSIDSTIKPVIRDDGHGNLYSTTAYVSQSKNHASHSTNHVGNIIYEDGIVILKETGSWSGSVSYMDMFKGSYSAKFNVAQTLYTTEYYLRVEPEEFLHTQNPTSRTYKSIGNLPVDQSASLSDSPFYRNELTSSEVVKNGWAYVTTIGLYDLDYSPEPLIVARLANPLKRDSRVPITFKLKVDNIV